MTEPAKSANQVVDELAEENAQLKEELDHAQIFVLAASKALAQAGHHFQQILVDLDELDDTGAFLRDVRAHVTAGLDACRNTKAGKE